MRAREILIKEALVDYSSSEEMLAAAQKVCDEVKAAARGIRIEVIPRFQYGSLKGIEVTDLYADAPGNGAGSKIMGLLFRLADEAGLNVYVNAEGPRSARFYQKIGMERTSGPDRIAHWVKYPDLGPDYDYLYESIDPQTYYHVTFASNLPTIQKQGLVILRGSNWDRASGGAYAEPDMIYLFTTQESAARWAFKMEWDFKEPVVILEIQGVTHTDDDPSGEQYLMVNGAGTWKRYRGRIPPEAIKRVIPWDTKTMARKIVAANNGEPFSLTESAENPSAIVHAMRDRWVEEEGRTPREINSGQCFDFAGDLEHEHPELFQVEGFGNFCNHNFEAGECSDDATGFHIDWMEQRGWHPPAGKTWDDMWELFQFDGTHGWAYCEKNGLCYDIEHPDGVKNVFDLSFLRRIIDSH